MGKAKYLVGIILLCLALWPLLSLVVLPQSSVGVVNEAWQLNVLIDKIVVDGETKDPSDLVGQISFDADGDFYYNDYLGVLVNPKPTVSAGVSSSLSPSTDDPESIDGYDLYRYYFGLDITTAAYKDPDYPLFYESDVVIVSVYFTVWLDKGIYEDVPEAKITDVAASNVDVGIIRQPTWDSATITADYTNTVDPAKNVNAVFVPISQGNEQLIDGMASDFSVAYCHLTAKLGAGGIIEWTYWWIFPLAYEVQVDDVFANYDCYIDVAVEKGGKAPITSPFDFLIQIFQSLGIIAGDEPINWWIIIAFVVFLSLATIIVVIAIVKWIF
jgi:hypothetical protein